MRTTSSLESFHSALNRSMEKKSNFFKFMVGLKLYESRKVDQMYSLLNNNQPKKQFEPKLCKDRERHNKINHYTKLFEQKKINIKEFLVGMATDGKCA